MPKRIAAIAPVCGGGDGAKAEWLKSIPIWIFHGDAAVSWKYGAEMVEVMNLVGCEDVQFTTIPNGSHGIWQEIYSYPQLYHWFLKHSGNEAALTFEAQTVEWWRCA